MDDFKMVANYANFYFNHDMLLLYYQIANIYCQWFMHSKELGAKIPINSDLDNTYNVILLQTFASKEFCSRTNSLSINSISQVTFFYWLSAFYFYEQNCFRTIPTTKRNNFMLTSSPSFPLRVRKVVSKLLVINYN